MGLENVRCPGLEKALAVFPELFPCPVCGNEMEIWSDEKKGRCAQCKKTVDPRQPARTETPSGKKKGLVAVREHVNPSGATLHYERYETVIPLSAMDYDRKYKVACEACHNFGKNLACPPYSPNLREHITTETYAKVLCIRMPQEYFRDVIQENMYRQCFRTARGILVEELLQYRRKGYAIAGSGYCLACDVCAVAEGSDICKKPDKKIYSLESLGVNLTQLTKVCFDFDLEWSAHDHAADFVCSIGAIFLHENNEIG